MLYIFCVIYIFDCSLVSITDKSSEEKNCLESVWNSLPKELICYTRSDERLTGNIAYPFVE